MLTPTAFHTEVAANAVTTASIFLAGRNQVLTWPVGIAGSLLFGAVFYHHQLYADALLQIFFVATSLAGWRQWRQGERDRQPPVTRVAPRTLGLMLFAAAGVTALYGGLLHRYTNAYAPFADSAVLGFSVVAQLLLMQRRLETWPTWWLVNTLSVPLFASRGLTLTAVLYAAYWVNSLWGGWHWWRQWRASQGPAAP
jgi:nicotinamide mononucleotide transporter